jgi:hypothetical protein
MMTGYPTNPSPSPIVLSSTMIHPTEPTVPPPEVPAISGYSSTTPITSIIVSHIGGHGPVVSSTFSMTVVSFIALLNLRDKLRLYMDD